ncbi:ABC transporter substrate-binding protein [Aureibacillus halotolerans]|uniref:ABC-type nitrate/sulfonate/bicarbonate transport system substrate-binding protein n=1 Tax=Aureibacillus halotolerans TaxID=1508390 RepID=A0A4R6TVN4_9BACI|nr:ABC transporter substrate-binding protein [Aureibacillus halotolerans]TDQ36742.1 ABC-type nitrate/sulfonate/bicarbonate transport system substrate-binding protein [Aureibacillus halotolerans]
MNKHWLFALLLSSLFLLAACTNGASPEEQDESKAGLTDVTVMLDWFPNTNHTGLYVAQQKGFFEEAGINVTIQQPGEGTTADTMVASGTADFGISTQENVTLARTKDIPVVSVAAIIQHNTSSFASLAEDNITTVNDFEGKRYGGWGSESEEATLRGVMQNAGADPDNVEMITLGATDFLKAIGRDADIMWIFDGWDLVGAELAGKDIHTIPLREIDPALDYYTPVLISNESLLSEQPDLAKSFMDAVSKGYTFAIEEPEEAADILLEAAPELDAELVKKSQAYLSKEYQADASAWGIQNEDVWQRYADWMSERGLIEDSFTAVDAFSNDFLP